jgi:hypothetical protein
MPADRMRLEAGQVFAVRTSLREDLCRTCLGDYPDADDLAEDTDRRRCEDPACVPADARVAPGGHEHRRCKACGATWAIFRRAPV